MIIVIPGIYQHIQFITGGHLKIKQSLLLYEMYYYYLLLLLLVIAIVTTLFCSEGLIFCLFLLPVIYVLHFYQLNLFFCMYFGFHLSFLTLFI